jgi:DNA-directed RNA polymerase specialized sigma24 family protein
MDLDVHLSAIVAGEPDAFGRWIAGAERPLRESLRSFATRVDVEAVLQESLLRTWQVAPRVELDGRPNALLRMALRVTRNLAIDEVRKARTVRVEDEEMERSLAFATQVVEPDPLLRRVIHDCRERLPQKQKEVMNARMASAGAHPDATLAAELGMRLNTFLQNFTRARKLLADCLRAHGVEIGGGAG